MIEKILVVIAFGLGSAGLTRTAHIYPDFSLSYNRYPIVPWGMAGNLEYIKQHYNNPPIYIHENGQRTLSNLTFADWPRIEYMQAYIGTLNDAIRNGTNVKGYFPWCFMDSFELMDGYESSFGLYYVDFNDPELKRQPKLSALWYSRFLKRKSTSLDGLVESPFHNYI